MKISVAVIAHNEERWIKECIESLLKQTRKPDEIVILAHNCTDRTVEIARNYPVKVIEYIGPDNGATYARIKSMDHVVGEIILCTDGDSRVAKNWVEEMSKILEKGYVLVGSWIKFKGTFFGWLSNLLNKYNCAKPGGKTERWIWGASMGFWGKDKELIKTFFEKSIFLTKKLGLTRNPDDYWLALFMKSLGDLAVTNKTFVVSHVSERSSIEAIKRNRENLINGNKMEEYFSTLY